MRHQSTVRPWWQGLDLSALEDGQGRIGYDPAPLQPCNGTGQDWAGDPPACPACGRRRSAPWDNNHPVVPWHPARPAWPDERTTDDPAS